MNDDDKLLALLKTPEGRDKLGASFSRNLRERMDAKRYAYNFVRDSNSNVLIVKVLYSGTAPNYAGSVGREV